MNYARIALAALGGLIAYFAFGFLVFTWKPMVDEYRKYETLYRSQDEMKKVMPLGMVFMFIAILGATVIYAMTYRAGYGAIEGLRFGALLGLFSVGSFVVHNYVNLKIGGRLSVQQAVAYFFEWTVVGLVIGLIYKSV